MIQYVLFSVKLPFQSAAETVGLLGALGQKVRGE